MPRNNLTKMSRNNLTTDQIMAAEQLRFIWNAKKKALKLTQEKLAQLCGWSTQSSFNDYLQARVPLNIEAILRISKVLQIHPTEIMPVLVDLLPTDTPILAERKILTHSENMIINILRSITDEEKLIAIKSFDDQNNVLSAKLILAYEEIATQKIQKEKRAFELSVAINSLTVQLAEKMERDKELLIANQNFIVADIEKAKRAAELEFANTELAFQNSEKVKRADELELAYKQIAVVNEEFKATNEDLISEGVQKAKLVTKLKFQNSEKEKMVAQLLIANQNNEKLNQQLNHLQKVESIGRMTAGISHDFNNILACMLGYNEMNNDIRDDIEGDALKSELDNNTKQIANAGQRAVALIGKMMTYARQNEETKIEIDERPMNAKIHDVLEMLKPMLTSKIQLNFVNDCDYVSDPEQEDQDNCVIQIDTTHLHQIITNLVVNARDAMKETGDNILISLKKVVLSDIHCMACGEMMSGEFIKLAVTDNGSGMEPKIIRRIFDPFFTTKPQGEGTGLGLSTIMGLVHSANGHILVESHLSGSTQGTSFKMLFPLPVRQMR